MHFENNPTRKIKTKHLRVKSDGEKVLQDGIDYHLFNMPFGNIIVINRRDKKISFLPGLRHG